MDKSVYTELSGDCVIERKNKIPQSTSTDKKEIKFYMNATQAQEAFKALFSPSSSIPLEQMYLTEEEEIKILSSYQELKKLINKLQADAYLNEDNTMNENIEHLVKKIKTIETNIIATITDSLIDYDEFEKKDVDKMVEDNAKLLFCQKSFFLNLRDPKIEDNEDSETKKDNSLKEIKRLVQLMNKESIRISEDEFKKRASSSIVSPVIGYFMMLSDFNPALQSSLAAQNEIFEGIKPSSIIKMF